MSTYKKNEFSINGSFAIRIGSGFEAHVTSVTRFGEISPLGHNFKKFLAIS